MFHFLFMNIAHLISKTKHKLKFLADLCDANTLFLCFFVKLSYMMVSVILKSSYLILVLPDVIDCLGLGVGFVFT